MNLKQKWILPLSMVMMMLTAVGCSSNANEGASSGDTGSTDSKSYKIGISQIVEHPSLDETRKGFLAALKDAGIVEGQNLTVDYKNAQGDSTNNLSIAQTLSQSDNDLVLAIATPSAQAVVSQVKDTPVLFAAVTDPLSAKIVSDLQKPGRNVSGASDTNPEAITELADFIGTELPDIKTIGLVINEGEPNAVIMAQRAEEAFKKHGITLIKAAVTNTSEVQQAAQSLVGRADAFYITLDNSVVSAVDTIIQLANENKMPFFSSDRDTVEKGAFATVGFKYYDHGYQVGQMAVDVLKNGKNVGDLPVAMQEKLDLILNLKAAEAQGIKVTDEMKAKVKDPENNLIQ
ncbi:putative ABC transport system substrate-binding protein [Paenibacillus sp. SORGH_AS306]|uniref:ABC transporter substrate-binding protein n=1 Tax=unclassified Paenibacillus TaxID=185978 RepID=UPI002782DBF5|nr:MULTISPECIES: ABC transporter substrate-binding protein [unclassified Paenibacillus]MDQ1234898.1 putative ABC transport system substrate-binding protein [Paenibacillus sp. SORGH_AS_0306]MDR6111947.1 putative ABC transport system substrate-binding protein [Paenibacillus sp. SORGH_AS_0338]